MEQTTHIKKSLLCLVAGKSGGHIIPCLSIAQHWKTEHQDSSIIFFSTNSTLDKQIISNNKLVDIHVPLTFGTHTHYFLSIRHALSAFFKSFIFFWRNRPKKIITTGGAVAVPVCLAAWMLRIPIELYELNAIPGKAIKFLSPFAHHIFVCFNYTQRFFPQHKCQHIQYPVRFTKSDHLDKEQALQSIGFSTGKKTIFIIGGSQGSHYLNTLMHEWLEQYPQVYNHIQIIHQTGSHMSDIQAWYAHNNIPAHVFAYHDNLAHYYNAADLIISRAGAGLLFEIAFFKKKCLIIPLETKSTNHQKDNALAMAQEYPALVTVLKQSDKENIFIYLIMQLQICNIHITYANIEC